MSSHVIKPRGKEGEETLIAVVSRVPGKPGEKGFQLHFPCLSVHVLWNGEDGQTGYDCITWSNYHNRPIKSQDGKTVVRDYSSPEFFNTPPGCQYGENPGSFNIKRIEFEFEMLNDKDTGNNRRRKYVTAAAAGGLECFDMIEMAKQYGTHFSRIEGWTFGAKHPRKRTEELVATSASFVEMEKLLVGRYGETMGMQILDLFLGHELLQKFLSEESGLRMAA